MPRSIREPEKKETMTEWSDGRKNRGACSGTRGARWTRSRRNERSASRFIGSTVKKLRLASRPPVLHCPPHCWRNVLRTRNEITASKRDSPRLPSGQIRISSGDKPARDSVHRSWTYRISFLLATRRNHGADAFVDDSPSERQFERERSLPMDRGRRTFGRSLRNKPLLLLYSSILSKAMRRSAITFREVTMHDRACNCTNGRWIICG